MAVTVRPVTTAVPYDGSVTDAKVAANAGIQESKIAGLTTDLASKIPLTQRAAVNGVATLDGSGKVPTGQLPALAINDTFVVASQAAMLALTAQRGDMAIRTDVSKTFVLATDDPTLLVNWVEISNTATRTKAGTPSDADFTTTPPDGTLVTDTTTRRLWMRGSGIWFSTSHGDYSVKAWGAKGDGATDDAAAIQACITAAPFGARVIFPPGTYLVGTTISLAKGHYYLGPNRETTTIKMKAGANLDAVMATETWLSTTATAGDNPVSVQGITIDGNKANQTAGLGHGLVCISFWANVDTVTVQNTRGHNFLFTAVRQDGVELAGSQGVETHIFRCMARSADLDGFSVRDPTPSNQSVTDGWFDSCIVSGCGGDAIHIDSGSGWCITNCHTYSVGKSAYYVGRGDSVRIIGNYSESWGISATPGTYSGIALGDGVTGFFAGPNPAVIANNTIYTSAGFTGGTIMYGIRVATSAGAVGRVAIVGNTVYGRGFFTGLSIGHQDGTATTKARISGNHIENWLTNYNFSSVGTLEINGDIHRSDMATTTTRNFLRMPGMPGVPTGVPDDPSVIGIPTAVDTVGKTLYGYLGSAWTPIGAAPGAYAPPRQPNSAVIFGDSITAQNTGIAALGEIRWSTFGYFHWANLFLRQRLRLLNNAGIGGNWTSNMLARIQTDVLAYNPGWCIILGGVNDVGNSSPAATIIANLTTICDTLIAAGIRPVLGTIGPTGYADTTTEKQIWHDVNRWIHEYCQSSKWAVLWDWTSAVIDPAVTDKPVWLTNYNLTSDGAFPLHPAPVGAARMGRRLFEVLDPLIPYNSMLPDSNIADSSDDLVPNRFAMGNVSGLATGWTLTSGFNATPSKVARTDGIPGEWQQVVLGPGGSASVGYTATTGWTAGDRVVGECEFETEPFVSCTTFQFSLYADDSTFTQLAALRDMWHDSTYAYPLENQPLAGVFRTPEYTIPSNMAHIKASLFFQGEGTIRISRMSIRKVTP